MKFKGLRVVVGFLSLLLLPSLCYGGFNTDDLELSSSLSLDGQLTLSDNLTVASAGTGSTTYIKIFINDVAYILTAVKE